LNLTFALNLERRKKPNTPISPKKDFPTLNAFFEREKFGRVGAFGFFGVHF